MSWETSAQNIEARLVALLWQSHVQWSCVIQKYVPDKILQPFMDDINKLEKV